MVNIFPINITEELRTSFLEYSMSVIIGRALPDIRDGLKPVHRRILYAMYAEGLLSSKKFSKCAGVVGEVLKKYHPHGDMPVYESLVRMAQPWNMRDILIEGQGNFGSVDGDSAAAYRYTEARLSKFAEQLLRDIDKSTVDFIDNFDNTSKEPTVLPSRVPNLLINGSEGIAVAMATRCPPHNLEEIINACLAIIHEKYNNGEFVNTEVLLKLIPGPDFPTGGYIYAAEGYREVIDSGAGSIIIRGKARVEYNDKTKRQQIIIDEIPYQINKARLLERIVELAREKRIDGIIDIRDESDRAGMHITIDLRKDVFGEAILNQLYKLSTLQTSFPINMLSIVNGEPKVLGMKTILEEFISFRQEIVARRSRHELTEAKNRFHLLTGLLVGLNSISLIIDLIKSSPNTEQAKKQLKNQKFTNIDSIEIFKKTPTTQIETWLKQGYAALDDLQVNAILEIRLAKFVGLEISKLNIESETLVKTIIDLTYILNNSNALMKVIELELLETKKNFSTPRKSIIIEKPKIINKEDLIPEEQMVITISYQGYIKRTPLDNYHPQKPGGKGKQTKLIKEEDFIQNVFMASTHSYLLIFTNLAKVYWLKVHEIPITGAQSKGKLISSFLQLAPTEAIRAVLPIRNFPTDKNIIFVLTATKKGQIKKTDLTEYANPRNSGLFACKIDKDDELIGAKITERNMDIILATKRGLLVRFNENNIRTTGRKTVGVCGISLRQNDEVVSMEVLSNDTSILTITELGYGKRTNSTKYRLQKRGGLGLINIKCDNKNGLVVSVIQTSKNDDIIVCTNLGTLIRVNAAKIAEIGRHTKGKKIITINQKRTEKVISAFCVKGCEELIEDQNLVEGQSIIEGLSLTEELNLIEELSLIELLKNDD